MSWLDPYDEVVLRVLVGRAIPAIETGRREDELYSYPLGAAPPGWWTKGHREPIARRRQRGLDLLNDPECGGLGTLDIADYYRSVSPGRLADVLTALRCPTGAVETLVASLAALTDVEGPGGLPIGFEGSAILANAFLYPADAVLRGEGAFLRYTDDVWVFPKDQSAWQRSHDRFVECITGLGLEVNPEKAEFLDKRWDDPWGVIQNRTLDSITGGGEERVTADVALELLQAQASAESLDWTVVRFALSNLAFHRSSRGVGVVHEHPNLFVEEPVAVSKYLVSLSRDPKAKKALDHDWLVERATKPNGPRALASRLHSCRVAAQLGLGKAGGRAMFEMATCADLMRQVPLQTWAATAWGGSADWKARKAVDATEFHGALSVQRAFCLPFAGRGRDMSKRRQWNAHLSRIEPDLQPTLDYAMS